jgi:hypothetical protein
LAIFDTIILGPTLVAAILAFASKTAKAEASSSSDLQTFYKQLPESYFSDLATRYVDDAIVKCGDDPPPLCLLQALVLTTHWLLIQGVRRRAWRYLGVCVRIAYELNLNVIDAGKVSEHESSSLDKWCDEEERRRVW